MRILQVVAIGVGLCLVPLPSQAQVSAALSPAEVAKVNAISQIQVKAILAKDWTTMVAQYTDDAVLCPANEPAVKGRAAIRAWSEKFPPVSAMTITLGKVEGVGDLAYVLGTYTMTIAPPGAPPVKDVGKFVEVRRRQADGKWLVAVDMFSSDLPAAPAAPAAPLKK